MSTHVMAQVWDAALPPTAKLVALVLADCANRDGTSIMRSVPTIVAMTGLSERTVRNIMSTFRGCGILEVTEEGSQYRPPTYRILTTKLPKQGRKICTHDEFPRGANDDMSGVQMTVSRGAAVAPDPKHDPKHDPKQGKTRGAKKPRPRFVKPTVDQVQEYCDERDNDIDAEAFVAHYEAVGWVYGKDRKPVKNWKACVVTWETRRKAEVAEREDWRAGAI